LILGSWDPSVEAITGAGAFARRTVPIPTATSIALGKAGAMSTMASISVPPSAAAMRSRDGEQAGRTGPESRRVHLRQEKKNGMPARPASRIFEPQSKD